MGENDSLRENLNISHQTLAAGIYGGIWLFFLEPPPPTYAPFGSLIFGLISLRAPDPAEALIGVAVNFLAAIVLPQMFFVAQASFILIPGASACRISDTPGPSELWGLTNVWSLRYYIERRFT